MSRSARARPNTAALRVVQLLAAGTLAAGLWGLAVGGAGAQQLDTGNSGTANTNTYQLSAQANALDVLVKDPSAPLSSDLAIEAGPWGASASLNSLGESMADAGAPYSPSVASLPGTVNGIGGGNFPPLPPIPGYVSADYPSTPTNAQTQGGYQISSTAGQQSARGAVSLGVQPSGSPNPTFFASAQTTANNDGSASVTASAGMDALDIGQLLDLGNVSSSLSLTQQTNQQPKVTSQTNLGTVTLAGQASGLSAGGLGALGIGTPVDLTGALITPLNAALASAGVKLAYVPQTFTYTDGTSSTGSSPDGSKTLQSVDSSALQVTVAQNIPSQGQTSITYTLGRVYASTTNTPGIAPNVADGTVGNTGTPTGNSGSGTAVLGNSGSFSSGGSLGSSAPAPGGTTPAAPSSAGGNALAESPAFALEQGPPTESVYLMLVLCALAVLLGSQAVRHLAVRLAMSGSGRGGPSERPGTPAWK